MCSHIHARSTRSFPLRDRGCALTPKLAPSGSGLIAPLEPLQQTVIFFVPTVFFFSFETTCEKCPLAQC